MIKYETNSRQQLQYCVNKLNILKRDNEATRKMPLGS